jgi:hypothetical protein
MGAYKGNASTIHEAEVRHQSPAFKKGGKTEKAMGGCMKKGSKAVMSEAAKGKKPARASGGGVFSSAKGGTPRGKASHY